MQSTRAGSEALNSIVCLKLLHDFPLDGHDGGYCEATGFVVNADKGQVP